MKLVIGVISSRNPEYDSFKDIWIQNVIQFNRYSRNKIDVYFLYCHRLNCSYDILQIDNHIYDFFCNDVESFQNILKKTVVFFKYISQTNFNFLIRSNASTLFEFDKLFYWLHTKPDKLFFAGTYVGLAYPKKYMIVSGTNLTFSKDIVCLIAFNMNVKIYNELIDDVAISLFLSNYDIIIRENIKRLDFTDTIIYNRCKKYDPDIFCFRFKTANRIEDVLLMYQLFNKLYTSYNLLSFIKKTHKKIIEQPLKSS